MGKSRTVIDRPINLLYPLEWDSDQVYENNEIVQRVRRNAAILGELRRKGQV